ncbi:hypothetical protein [Streptomyces griseorubiginosus]
MFQRTTKTIGLLGAATVLIGFSAFALVTNICIPSVIAATSSA